MGLWDELKDYANAIMLIVIGLGSISAMSNLLSKKRLTALVWHVDHRFVDYAKIPEIYAHLSSRYNTILLPQIEFDWETMKSLLEEFRPFPIMLDVFSSIELNGEPYRLEIDQIEEVIHLNDIRALRFHEVFSWHWQHNRDLPMPYVNAILNYCKEHKIFLFWNEWDIMSFDKIKNMVKGYEDYVMFSYETIGQFEPVGGFYAIMGAKYWGACVTSWYWTNKGGDQKDMPIDLMIQFSKQARDLGAVIIQYEPYSYFFENSTPKGTLKPLLEAI